MERDIESNFDAFNDYASKYDLSVKMIGYKYEHSYRVMKASEDIAKSMNLSKEDVYLASLIGLLHDIGRFEQWTKYQTYKDSEVFDHSTYGVELLFDKGLIKEFNCEESEYEIIKTAILYHNDYSIPETVTDERVLMHSKIIRDADKLDILYAFSNPRILEMHESNDEISEKIKLDFFNQEQSYKTEIKNDNDKIIIYFGFVFDFNYEYTFKTVYDNEYYTKINGILKNKKIFNIYYESTMAYIESRLSDGK